MDKRICNGCLTNLSKARELPIKMSDGLLIVTCPLCKFNIIAKTNDAGEIVFLNQK